MSVTHFLNNFGRPGGMHHFHRFLFGTLDELLIVAVKIEGDVRDTQTQGRISPSRRMLAQ